MHTLFTIGDKYPFLEPGDYIEIKTSSEASENILIRLNVKYTQKINDYLWTNHKNHKTQKMIFDQIGENVTDNENIFIYEFDRANREEVE